MVDRGEGAAVEGAGAAGAVGAVAGAGALVEGVVPDEPQAATSNAVPTPTPARKERRPSLRAVLSFTMSISPSIDALVSYNAYSIDAILEG